MATLRTTGAAASLALLVAAGCGKPSEPAATAAAPIEPPPSAAPAQPAAEVPVAAETANVAEEAAGAAAAEPAAPAAPDARANAWGLTHRPATVKTGDRVYVVTKGRDRTMVDAKAVYQLFAHDVASVDEDVVTIA